MATVLYVEDNADHRLMMYTLLKSQGFDVRMAPNGFKGMMLAREVRPDIILLDLYMPKMDGYCMMEHLVKDPVTHGIPVIVVSAWPTGDQVERALQGGARAFVSKPYDNEKLVNLINENLAEPVESKFVVLDVHSAEV